MELTSHTNANITIFFHVDPHSKRSRHRQQSNKHTWTAVTWSIRTAELPSPDGSSLTVSVLQASKNIYTINFNCLSSNSGTSVMRLVKGFDVCWWRLVQTSSGTTRAKQLWIFQIHAFSLGMKLIFWNTTHYLRRQTIPMKCRIYFELPPKDDLMIDANIRGSRRWAKVRATCGSASGMN